MVVFKNSPALGNPNFSNLDIKSIPARSGGSAPQSLIEGHNLLWWENKLAALKSELSVMENQHKSAHHPVPPIVVQIVSSGNFHNLLPELQLQSSQSPLHSSRLPGLSIEQLKKLVDATHFEATRNHSNSWWNVAWKRIHLHVSVLQATKIVAKLQGQSIASGTNPLLDSEGSPDNSGNTPPVDNGGTTPNGNTNPFITDGETTQAGIKGNHVLIGLLAVGAAFTAFEMFKNKKTDKRTTLTGVPIINV